MTDFKRKVKQRRFNKEILNNKKVRTHIQDPKTNKHYFYFKDGSCFICKGKLVEGAYDD